ncbi:MAG: DNA polymerase III subunit delta [Candidatus Omnitrophica bacterium]|nr:DNA polymerase III subunit delta [Candidatus Omnitrophota bacterium]
MANKSSTKLKPVIALQGDSFLVEERVKDLTLQIEKEAGKDISKQSCSLSETTIESVFVQARTLPFLATAQIFYLSDCHKLKKADLESLQTYLENPASFSFLIFKLNDDDKADAVLKALKTGGAEMIVLEDHQSRSIAGRFIQEKLSRAGKKMDPRALQALDAQWKDAPEMLDTMLERLILFAGSEDVITLRMVEMFEENWAQTDAFKLTDALAAKNTAQALKCLNEIIDENTQDVLSLMGLLHWQFRRLWQAKVMLERGVSQNETFSKCRVSPRQSSFFLRHLKNFTRSQLEKALDGLFDLDWGIKTGRAEGPSALESWVVRVTNF